MQKVVNSHAERVSMPFLLIVLKSRLIVDASVLILLNINPAILRHLLSSFDIILHHKPHQQINRVEPSFRIYWEMKVERVV